MNGEQKLGLILWALIGIGVSIVATPVYIIFHVLGVW
jgi:hypothetical protein